MTEFITTVLVFLSGLFGGAEPQTFGAFGNPFFSHQLATTSLVANNILINNGTHPLWVTCTTLLGAGLCDGSDDGGGGSSFANGFIIATTSNVAVPQLAYFSKASGTTTLASVATTTLSGTAGQVSVSNSPVLIGASGAVLSLPSHVIFPGNFQATRSTTTHATSTNLDVTGLLTFNGVTGDGWTDFCTTITGGAGLCDGTDAAGAGGTGSNWQFTAAQDAIVPTTTVGVILNASSTFSAGLSILNTTVSTSTVVSKQTAGSEYTTVQGAIAALWRPVLIKGGTFAEQISILSTKTKIIGESLLATIQANGSTQSPAISATTTDETYIEGITVTETNAADVGVGVDFSNTAVSRLLFSRINNFATSTLQKDTSSNTFYNLLLGNLFFNCGSACIELSGTQANANNSAFNRSRPMQTANGGFGHYLVDARGFSSFGDDIEGTSTTNGITGVYIATTSREISYFNPWIEANQTGVHIDTGARRVNFFGGSITSNGTDVTNNGTDVCFWNVSITGVTRNECNGNFKILSPGILFASTTVADYASSTLSTVATRLYVSPDAAGGVIDFANGDVTLTNGTGNNITFDGGTLNVTNGDIVVGTAGKVIDLQSSGIRFASNNDGMLTISSLGDGTQENLTLDIDDTANTAVWGTGTGVADMDFGTMDLIGDVFQHTSGGILTMGNTDTTGHALFTSGQTLNSSSGVDIFARFAQTINQTGTAGTNVLEVDTTNTALGSGRQNLAAFQSANTDRFVFGFDGSAGFGTSTPKWNLQIASSTGPQLALSDGSQTSVHWTMRNAGGNLYFATSSASTYATGTPAAVEFRNEGTALGIGTSSPWRTLSVVGTMAINGLSTATGDNAVCIDATTKEIEDANGATCALSTILAKENVLSLNTKEAVDILARLRPVSFDWKEGYRREGDPIESISLIAEEVEAVDPRFVDHQNDGKPHGLSANAFIGLLVSGFQDLLAKVTGLEARMDTIEKENAELRARLDAAGI